MSKAGDSVQIQPRDVELLRGLFESRIMTLAHATALHFSGKAEMCKKRVQRLKSAGLIGERKRMATEPSVLFLTQKAHGFLSEHGHLDGYPAMGWERLERRVRVSDQTLGHELEVMDVKAAMVTAVRSQPALSIAEFTTWPILCEFDAVHPNGKHVTVCPDGFLRLHETDGDGVFEHACYLEVDRSTETNDRLADKLQCYRDFYKRGGLAAKNGRPREAFQDFPFRVLVTCRTQERRNNLAERILQSKSKMTSQVWLTTIAEATSDPLGSIWITPQYYHRATHGTPFDPEQAAQHGAYRRQPEREQLVEERIVRRKLIGERATG